MIFEVGDIVVFNNLKKDKWTGRIHVTGFTDKNIPIEYVRHGNTVLDEEYYNKHHAKIICVGDNDHYGVETKMVRGVLRLAYPASVLEHFAVKNWRTRFQ